MEILRNSKAIALLGLVVIVAILGIYFAPKLFGSQSNSENRPQLTGQAPTAAEANTNKNMLTPDEAQKKQNKKIQSQKIQSQWSDLITPSKDGFILGNPDAKVKVREYGSYTCLHCSHFVRDSNVALKGYIDSGRVSLEFVSFTRNGVDMIIGTLTYCPALNQRFFTISDAFMMRQEQWLRQFSEISQDQERVVSATPKDQQMRMLARLSGLDKWARRIGITGKTMDRCLSLTDLGQRLLIITQKASKEDGINATPAFIINGHKYDSVTTWEQLERKIRALLE